jgi:hypothetical protein
VLSNRFAQTGHFGGRTGLREQAYGLIDDAGEALARWHEQGLPNELTRVLAGLAALGVLFWAGYFALRAYRPQTPRYASEVPLVAQGGLPGRAAVLAAPTTDRSLVLAEIEALLREELAVRAGLPYSSTPERSLDALESQSGRSLKVRARELLARGRAAREALLGYRTIRTSIGQLADYERRVQRLLDDIDK